jgi:hypothetical protein
VPFDKDKAVIHKIIIAHGAKEACERASPQNIYGSLAISYTETDGGPTSPFHIEIDRHNPVHVLDSHNMPIVLREMDTVSDFSAYLDEKVRAAASFDYLSYCGEEDLLGHYLLNYDAVAKRHVIGPKGKGILGAQNSQSVWPQLRLVQHPIKGLPGHIDLGRQLWDVIDIHRADEMQRDMPVCRLVLHTAGWPIPLPDMNSQLFLDDLIRPKRYKESLSPMGDGCGWHPVFTRSMVPLPK